MPARGRYPSDLTDRQWKLIEGLVPAVKPGGRPEVWPRREIVNAILYLTRTGCAWRMLPKDFPPWQTVYMYFTAWRDDGTVAKVHDALREQTRGRQRRGRGRRDPVPTAGVIDAQSLRGADTVGADRRGYDAGKKVNGTKRHIVVDTIGLLLVIAVTSASVQDRDGAETVLGRLHQRLPGVVHVFADGGYAGKLVDKARSVWKLTIEVVRKPTGQSGFSVLPRRWVVERTFAWMMRWRRLVRDYERRDDTHEALVRWAMIGLMLNRLAPRPGPKPWANKGN
jgi:transposase